MALLPRSIVSFLTWFAAFLAAATALHAQELGGFQSRPHWTVGYVANAPDQMLGFSLSTFGPHLRNWGFYIDAKFSLDSPAGREEFEQSLTPDQADALGDLFLEEQRAWQTFNLAVVRAVTPIFALYAGAGYGHSTRYWRYFDSSGERGLFGHYWTRKGSGQGLRALGGAWFRGGRFVLFQFGGETAPPGFTVGAALALPLGR
ncbi:MAG: hypothetical protein HY701_00015 [Gemmatimonadetes bacterium]|nr:hypothetical protein [Gemmatimonadota bacterium]